jgi:pimeloyl-ACP methyl ester carboxylesterase
VREDTGVRLRLYHHADGARVAYREEGSGRPLVLLHSLGLSHREWAPVVGALSDRFRVVLPDLPLHGDSEDRPRHPYSSEWLTEVVAGFCGEVVGSRGSIVGHGLGAELALRGVASGQVSPARLVLLNNRLHHAAPHPAARSVMRVVVGAGIVPGIDLALSHLAPLVFRPRFGDRLSAQHNRDARDLVRHAFIDVRGNGNRARAWAKFARGWPLQAQRDLLDSYGSVATPVLLLWAEEEAGAPLQWAQEALDLLPNAQLRTLSGAGFLAAYDDPVNLARELIWFCG